MNIFRVIPHCLRPQAALILFVAVSSAQVNTNPPAIVTRYCSGCHGVDGKSQIPYIPRLAGLAAPYLQAKFASYRNTRPPAVDEIVHLKSVASLDPSVTAAKEQMVGVAHIVSGLEEQAAIQWYAAQPPSSRKRSAGSREWIQTGKSLYTDGSPSQGLFACRSCHGPDATGNESVPRLAGQNAAYVANQLALFRAGTRSNPTMREVARHLEDNQARAIAAYVQSR